MGSKENIIVFEIFSKEEYKEFLDILKKVFPKEYERLRQELGKEPWDVEKRPKIILDPGDYFESSGVNNVKSRVFKVLIKNMLRRSTRNLLLAVEKAAIEGTMDPILAFYRGLLLTELYFEKMN